MNKFLGKKKAPPEPLHTETLHALTTSPQVSPGLRMPSASRWKKSRKQAETKPSLDIQLPMTLPSSDDFRTSLLMPNLSARFSMLREQDDPNSKLGKASDDSVLQPSRRSRMLDFGYGGSGLNDIAEVQSINSSIRPPFAMERSNSEDGYGSETDVFSTKTSGTGGIMSRARPGEGNTMFGGRQKVYKIPMSGGKPTGSGRAVYEDDIGLSAFQRWRQKDREARDARASDESAPDSRPFEYDFHPKFLNDSAKDLSPSPSWNSDPKRSTTSSVARSDTRSSTAATSVTSQAGGSLTPTGTTNSPHAPPIASSVSHSKRPDARGRRLYETGSEQCPQDQQPAALTRLNSTQRGMAGQPHHIQTARSVGNLHERAMQTVYTSQQNVPGSQQLPRRSGSRGPRPSLGSRPESPTTADRSAGLEADSLLALAIEPADRGKATALGAFNKPTHRFDEQQYLERQQQLQRSQSRTGADRASPASSLHQRVGRLESPRDRSDSNVSARSRSRSASAHRSATDNNAAYNMFQNASAQVARNVGQIGDKPTLSDPHRNDTHRTFFGNISASDSEDEEENGAGSHPAHSYRGWQPNTLPSVSEHPALRKRSIASLAEEDEDYESAQNNIPASRSLTLEPPKPFANDMKGLDSPTLPSNGGHALNGMVHHLRQRSNQSSIYPNDEDDDSSYGADDFQNSRNTGLMPRSLDLVQRRVHGVFDTDSGIGSSTTHSNPWDLDDMDAMGGHDRVTSPVSPVEPVNTKGGGSFQENTHILSRDDVHPQVSPEHDEMVVPWQTEMRKQQHSRDTSSATQQERDAFASELAARRNAIQESMKTMVGDGQNSRNVSPARAPSSSGFKPFGKLKPKPSQEHVVDARHVRDVAAPPKAKNLLGLAPRDQSRSREHPAAITARGESRDRSQTRDIQTSGLQRLLQPSDWVDSDVGTAVERSAAFLSASRPPTSRTRSDSAATRGAHSRGRTGERSDGPAAQRPVHPFDQELTPRPSPEVTQLAFDGLVEQNKSQDRTVQSNEIYSPPGSVAHASPPSSSMSQNMTPPLSGASTPMSQALASPSAGAPGQFSHQMPPQRALGNSLRKKTISKSDISEPTLISSTSNVDTVDLPPGASLKNGIEQAPPLPPINPKRRVARKILGMVRNDSSEDGALPLRTSISPENNFRGRGRRSNSGNTEPPATLRTAVSVPNLNYHQSPPRTRDGGPMGQMSPQRMASSHGQQTNGGMF